MSTEDRLTELEDRLTEIEKDLACTTEILQSIDVRLAMMGMSLSTIVLTLVEKGILEKDTKVASTEEILSRYEAITASESERACPFDHLGPCDHTP